VGRTPLSELLEVLRSDPQAIHSLLFEPDAIAAKLTSREAKALVFGISPESFLTALMGARGVIAYCGTTCGSYESCSTTCGQRSCDYTCGNSCLDTCKSSCGHTTDFQIRPVDGLPQGRLR
jgi:hypothetical protein